MNATQLIDKLVETSITKGMANAYAKQEGTNTCPECGMSIPKYPGAYPKRCPDCKSELEACDSKKRS